MAIQNLVGASERLKWAGDELWILQESDSADLLQSDRQMSEGKVQLYGNAFVTAVILLMLR